jgi:cytochrome P450
MSEQCEETNMPAMVVPVPIRQEVEGMVLMEAFLKETLRKYTVVPGLTRVAMALVFCGFRLRISEK